MKHSWLATLLVTLAAHPGQACSIPVFRYALEHWKPSTYELHLFHRGTLNPRQGELLERLQKASGLVNLSVNPADLNGQLPPLLRELWQQHGNEDSLPILLARFPESDETAVPAWTGSLDETSVEALLDSPVRRRLVELLAGGESAVWVLLSSGDDRADALASDLLERELARLQKELRLPVPTEPATSPLPLRLSFRVLRLVRTDPAEAALVRMLLHGEEGLEEVRGPIVFPVLGRGRVLLGLHGAELTAAQIERWASFLCGPCSCQVKELNPGFDLLLRADWDDVVATTDESVPAPPAPAAPPIPPGKPVTGTASGTPGMAIPKWLWFAGALAVLAGWWAARNRGEG